MTKKFEKINIKIEISIKQFPSVSNVSQFKRTSDFMTKFAQKYESKEF